MLAPVKIKRLIGILSTRKHYLFSQAKDAIILVFHLSYFDAGGIGTYQVLVSFHILDNVPGKH